MADPLVFLSIPQLRHPDVTPGALASLDALTARGGMADLVPPFPGLAASSFATLMTGTRPYQHGVIGNAYFDRSQRRVAIAPLPDSAVQAPKLWERLHSIRPEARAILWFSPLSRGAAVDRAAWFEPDHGLLTHPAELADALTEQFGPYPQAAFDPQSEPSRLEMTGWILHTAAATIASERPELAVIRVPYLGQIARRFGPDSREACRAVIELEQVLGPFLAALPEGSRVVAATESMSTPVSDPLYPNKVLRELGMLVMREAPGGGLDVDLDASAAFALADHQLCHIYLNDEHQAATVASAFSGSHGEGIDRVAADARRAALDLDHPRAGDVILVAAPDRWFAPDWWDSDEEIPRDLHATSGLAQPTPQGRLDPSHVHGSLGAPPPSPDYHGVIVASDAALLGEATELAARDVAGLLLHAWSERST